jgi:hypothetical protein
VCAFMHAADSGIHVTSNSYFVDPWLFACKNDPQQNAIVIAVNRCGPPCAHFVTARLLLHEGTYGNAALQHMA